MDYNLTQGSPIVVALDYESSFQALAMASQLDPQRCRLKVGKELFTAAGPQLVEQLQQQGFEIFLDLKFHDIPNTVAKAVLAAARMGVWMVNVHASGGAEMMQTTQAALKAKGGHQPLLIAVTVLTSMDAAGLKATGIDQTPAQRVLSLAHLSQQSGFDGVVCSAQESALLKAELGAEFKLVTPGIRPSFAVAGDQKRIMTPAQAIQTGSDYLVIGRPITQAKEPMQALEMIEEELG
ncbi:MAG: orotidine-5'-phosphate decarboxylase [Oceanospirillaceae bacterium]|nr:orotidine-5'-phosphate decarboxylase [Oceanospirillaceae bacterium]MBT4443483.1 orotidine-5'-phosphate decarboxylase [Oceanospirillaceae bacterium]MBT6076618.1 orotidine-5'-phosphate decarboxylase [Oceanospirillaceae bacterium]